MIGKRPLPGGDVMVVGFRDHAVEIEENGFQRHGLWLNPANRSGQECDVAIITNRAADRQIIDNAPPPALCCAPRHRCWLATLGDRYRVAIRLPVLRGRPNDAVGPPSIRFDDH